MKIGLLDVDGHNFPNIVLMKLSAWHKLHGDEVNWYTGIEHYNRVYMSKVFTFSPDDSWSYKPRKLSGAARATRCTLNASEEIEHTCPDYTIYHYPEAYGFLTRGCTTNARSASSRKKKG